MRAVAPAPDGAALPTGAELAGELLDRLAGAPGVRLRLGTRVQAVAREGLLKHEEIASSERGSRPFRLLLADSDGRESVAHADAVIDCTGTYGNPNWLGDGGIPAPGERALADRIARQLPAFDGASLGGLHGAADRRRPLRADGRAGARAARPRHRASCGPCAPAPDWGAVEGDPLPERAALTRPPSSSPAARPPVWTCARAR